MTRARFLMTGAGFLMTVAGFLMTVAKELTEARFPIAWFLVAAMKTYIAFVISISISVSSISEFSRVVLFRQRQGLVHTSKETNLNTGIIF